MSFLAPKKPKVEDAPPKVEVNEAAIDQTLRDRERKRQGYAAAILTKGQGLTGSSSTAGGMASKLLLGG